MALPILRALHAPPSTPPPAAPAATPRKRGRKPGFSHSPATLAKLSERQTAHRAAIRESWTLADSARHAEATMAGLDAKPRRKQTVLHKHAIAEARRLGKIARVDAARALHGGFGMMRGPEHFPQDGEDPRHYDEHPVHALWESVTLPLVRIKYGGGPV